MDSVGKYGIRGKVIVWTLSKGEGRGGDGKWRMGDGQPSVWLIGESYHIDICGKIDLFEDNIQEGAAFILIQ